MLVFLYIDSGSGLDGESRCNQEFVEILNLSEAIWTIYLWNTKCSELSEKCLVAEINGQMVF